MKFLRVRNDIGMHLKQRPDTYLTLFVDYYGINAEWPGVTVAKRKATPAAKAAQVNAATKSKVNGQRPDLTKFSCLTGEPEGRT